ncbi:AAA family ATPase [Stieleria sp. TO1_6]|uniref:ExeA family protein n=1 Tax=Stieleria tagensis TaxID=2956795 RepID=UPI00209ABC65|nr:AAA family ATPase [Stieleria tagensis]MCO8123023.1 AAA family ATPase [Stieleria tagensis]
MKNSEHDFTLPPFPGFPSTNRYVSLGPVLDTVTRVARSVTAREAISLVIGPPGTGKSLACALLAKQFAGSHDVVLIGETSINSETAFYRFLLHRLGVALDTSGHDDLELLLLERLTGKDANPNGLVLIVDEAASLSAEVLESIRRVTNLMLRDKPMVSAVVAGGVKLDETLTAPSMEPFVQRIASRCYLHPLSAGETRDYIRGAITACDASADETITDSAVSAIFHATYGVPRLINQLMTEAIDCAAELDQNLIDDHTVDKAWASLQQLPGPMTEEPSMKRQSSVIEFGELSADDAMDNDSSSERFSELDCETVGALVGDDNATVESAECQTELQLAPEPATDPVQLFGDFDDEESLEIGVGAKKQQRAESTHLDFESMLHSEIIGLSHYAAESVQGSISDTDATEDVSEELSIDTLIESDAASTAAKADGKDDEIEYPSVLWYDEPESFASETDDFDSPRSDDSDLLWITEDIDVQRRELELEAGVSPHRVDPAAQTDAPKLSIDYREMLEKMRNQS